MSKASGKSRKTHFKENVESCLRGYFQSLNGEKAAGLYKMVIEEAESALITVVMEYAENNQSKAADYLGITRGTLRKKIKQYGLDK